MPPAGSVLDPKKLQKELQKGVAGGVERLGKIYAKPRSLPA